MPWDTCSGAAPTVWEPPRLRPFRGRAALRLGHRSPNTIRKIPLSALGDFTTTIFNSTPSLFVK